MNRAFMLNYLSELEENNNKKWFHATKDMRDAVNLEFENLIQSLIISIGQSDASVMDNIPKYLTFKMVRDVRYSHDKSPYNPVLRAHISSKGKLPIPVGYFIRIKPDGRSFLGGGLFTDMFKDATKMIRDYISENGDEWQRIIQEEIFCKYFHVKGVMLKNVPRGYDKENAQAEYLKYKCWYIEYILSDEQISADDFVEFSSEIFKIMQPFNTFLNKALQNFVMPKRK